MDGTIYTVTVVEPGRHAVVADWPTPREATEFFLMRAGWLAQKGYRKDERRSTRGAFRMRLGLAVATVTLVAREGARGEG